MTIDFELLHKPFPKSEVKTRPGGGGKTLFYITARHVMNRLDNACGPENWRDEYAPSLTGEGVQCTIYIRIDGEWVGKSDVGTESNTEEDKGAYSDALKRGGVRWGIGRELHQDGLSNLAKQSQPSPHLSGNEPDTRAVALARETFPFAADVKLWKWQTFIAEYPTWNTTFWPAVDSLGLSRGDVHDALGVTSTKDWVAGNVAQLWLRLCEEKIELDDIANENETEVD